MRRELRFKPTADEQLTRIENDPALKGVLKQVRKTLGYLETNLRAKSLQTHEYESLTRRYGKKVFEAYVSAWCKSVDISGGGTTVRCHYYFSNKQKPGVTYFND